MKFSPTQKAYIARFLDGDGSIYVRLKKNSDFRYGFQVAPCVAFFQSSKDRGNFRKICALIGVGHLRERNDDMLEYIIQRQHDIQTILLEISPYLLLKKKQADLMLEILRRKSEVGSKEDFIVLMGLVDRFRTLNYSKRRKIHILTP